MSLRRKPAKNDRSSSVQKERRAAMNEKELNILAFVAKALVVAPEASSTIVGMARIRVANPSVEFSQVLNLLGSKFRKIPCGKSGEKQVRDITDALLNTDGAEKWAGRALAGALEELKFKQPRKE